MGKVYVSQQDVIVVMRHDPNSSDIVTIGAVLGMEFFDSDSESFTDEQLIEKAEAWAIDREIDFIKTEMEDTVEVLTQDQQAYVRGLNKDNFTKQTDLWFEPVIMPLLTEQAGPGEGAGR